MKHLAAFITALTGETGISATALWGAVSPIAPLVIVLILVKLGYNVLRTSVNSTTRIRSKKVM